MPTVYDGKKESSKLPSASHLGKNKVQVLDQEEPVAQVRKKCTVVLKLGTMDDANLNFAKSRAAIAANESRMFPV